MYLCTQIYKDHPRMQLAMQHCDIDPFIRHARATRQQFLEATLNLSPG